MEIEIKLNGKKEQVILKDDITHKEHQELLKAVYSSELDEETGKLTSSVDKIKYNELRLIKFIEKSSFELNIKTLQNLPSKIGIRLLEAVDRIHQVNLITDKDTGKSKGRT